MSMKPDYEAAAKAIDVEVKKWPSPAPSGLIEPGWWGATTLELARLAVDAALGGDPTAFAVAALIAEGGVERETMYQDDLCIDMSDKEPGRYLVFPIPVESAEAKETP